MLSPAIIETDSLRQ